MRLPILNRRIHYWGTLAVAIPLFIVMTTGILLQLKKEIPWVQPSERKGNGKVPTVTFEEMFVKIQSEPGFEHLTWEDVKRIDVRPSKGIAKWTLSGDWEFQVDSETAQVLQSAIRRSDWIEAMHDGSYFGGDAAKYGVFLPAALALALMWGSGLWMFWQPIQAKRRKRLARAKSQMNTTTP
ncbi:MAG: PepSY domain-containing protein [Pirellula sp.]|jgi:uncharacterized iron-regulated membrane protein|nr:PepSY domain-containing protein [Pirellula sp.]